MNKEEFLKSLRAFKNRQMYKECPEEWKQDYDFVMEVVKIFRDDFLFAESVAQKFINSLNLKHLEEDYRFLELIITLSYIAKPGTYEYIIYQKKALMIYNVIMSSILLLKDSTKNDDSSFRLVQRMFGDRKIIIDFIARTMTESIFNMGPHGNLEDLIHLSFDEFPMRDEEIFEEFLVDNVEQLEPVLAEYLDENNYLLHELVDELGRISNNWYAYNSDVVDACVKVVDRWFTHVSEEELYGNDFDYEQALGEVIVSEKLDQAFGIDKKEIIENRNKNNVISFSSMPFKKDLITLIRTLFVNHQTLTGVKNAVQFGEQDEKKLT